MNLNLNRNNEDRKQGLDEVLERDNVVTTKPQSSQPQGWAVPGTQYLAGAAIGRSVA